MLKHKTSFNLSSEGTRLLRALATHLGINQQNTIELIIREKAEREGLRPRGDIGPSPVEES